MWAGCLRSGIMMRYLTAFRRSNSCWIYTSMSRLRKRLARSKGFVFLIAALFILLLPIILPIALIHDRLRVRRIAKIVCSFVCISCGTVLGTEGLRLGNERWKVILANHGASSPGARFRILRDIHAVCPKCGCDYMYRDVDHSLVLRPQHKCKHRNEPLTG
jgi:hypothetical protein